MFHTGTEAKEERESPYRYVWGNGAGVRREKSTFFIFHLNHRCFIYVRLA